MAKVPSLFYVKVSDPQLSALLSDSGGVYPLQRLLSLAYRRRRADERIVGDLLGDEISDVMA
jgi:hypothetical protein